MNRNLSLYLDCIRFLAAAGVVLGHSRRFIYTDLSKIFSSHASECVVVFFVLSGFVIRLVTTNRENAFRPYAIARLSRMWSVAIPAVFVTVMMDRIGFGINPAFYSGLDFWNGPASPFEILSSLTFTNEIWGARITMGTNEPYWSLGYEVPYYIGFCAVFIPNLKWKLAFLTLWALSFGLQIVAYSAVWLLGVAALDVIRTGAAARLGRVWAWLFLGAPALYPALKYLVFHPTASPMRYESLSLWSINYAYYLTLGILFALHLVGFSVLFRNELSLPRWVVTSIRWFAGSTFTIYLMHQPLLVLLAALNVHVPTTPFTSPLELLSVFLILLVLAEIGERRKRWFKDTLDWLWSRSSRYWKAAEQDA